MAYQTKTNVRAASLLLGVAGLALGTARAQTTWTGGAGNGDWHTAQNWSTNAVPLPGDSVVIPAGFPGVSASGVFVQSLTAQSPLSVGGGGTVIGGGSASLKDFSTTGGFACPGGPVTFTGSVQVNASGFWIAAGGFTSSGLFSVTNMPLNQTAFTNTGTLKVENGNLTVGGGLSTLANSGTLELRSGGNLKGTGKVANSGAWRKVGASPSEVQCNIDHSGGTLAVEDGVLRLTGGGFYSAPMTVELGGTIRLEGPFVSLGHFFETASDVTGAGELEIQCAGSSAVQILDYTLFNLQGDDGLHMQSGGVMIAEGQQMANFGRLRWDGGSFEGPGLLNNFSGGTLTIPTGRSVSANDGVRIINSSITNIDGVLTLNEDSVLQSNAGTVFLRGEIRAPTPALGTVLIYADLVADPGVGNTARITARLRHEFSASLTVNSGTLSLLGGGNLGPGPSMIELVATQPGTLLAFDSGTYDVTGSDVHLIAEQGAETRIRGAGTVVSAQPGILNLQGEGTIVLHSNAQLGGPGQIINTGNFVWNSQIGVNGQATFINQDGAVMIPVGGAKLRGSFKNEMAGDVVQEGTLDMAASTVTNKGGWILQPTNAAQIGITGVGGLFHNAVDAIVSAEAPPSAGQSAQISTTLDNEGIVQAIGGITLTINGQLVQLQNGVLSGGTWRTAEGGRIILPGIPPITTIRNASVAGSQQGMPWLTGVRNVEGGQLLARDDIVFTAPLNFGEGNNFVPSVMRIGPGAQVTVPGGTTVGSPVQGSMSFLDQKDVFSLLPDPPMLTTPLLTMHGGMRPGGADEPGPFNLTGQLAMQPSGLVEIELGGLAPETEHDVVTIAGGATLAGTLDLSLVNGFVPALGQAFAILTATGGVTGTFAAVNQPVPMPPGLEFVPVYTAGGVTLRVGLACYPDCNGDGALTVADFGCFQTKFVIGDPYADCNGDGQHSVGDFGCFQTRFVVGCP